MPALLHQSEQIEICWRSQHGASSKAPFKTVVKRDVSHTPKASLKENGIDY